MASVLVTGMSAVGVAIARKFAEEGYEVILYDVAPKKIDYIEEMPNRIKVVRGDITDLSFFLDTAKKYEVEGVVHTALLLMGTPFQEYPSWSYEVNVGGVQKALEVARMRNLKFLYVSSAAAYGIRPETDILREDDPTLASWPTVGDNPVIPSHTFYLAHKVMSELLTTAYSNAYGMDTVIIRLGSVWGPGDTHILRKDVRLFALLAMQGKQLRGPEGRDHPRDYSYTKNLAHGAYLAYTVRPLKHRVFNISDFGRLVRNQEAIEVVRKVVPGADISLGPGVWTELLRTASPWLVCPLDTTRAREELGYRPPYNLEQAVRDYIGWLKKNPEWIERYSEGFISR